ncbi:hypothetical protein [Thaumasiovibrio sp. DFM-14]|uniref:hypothetical protein n=1 Tax=Thaumasiovibrio sp. DFM-14 TaxID=3384792 RepID=UPI0039A3D235
MINKDGLRQQLVHELERQRQNALWAADNAHNAATHEESKAETQYDTIGLEAAYLAHGQSQRVADCESAILRLKALVLREFTEDDEIDIGAIVTLSQGLRLWLLPVAGGEKLLNDIVVVTPASPLGTKLMGAYVEEALDDGRQICAIE